MPELDSALLSRGTMCRISSASIALGSSVLVLRPASAEGAPPVALPLHTCCGGARWEGGCGGVGTPTPPLSRALRGEPSRREKGEPQGLRPFVADIVKLVETVAGLKQRARGRRVASEGRRVRAARGAMVKAYLRYAQHDAFGVIASPNCNAVVHPDGTVFTGALESVLRWSARTGVIAQRLRAAAASGPGAEAVAEVVRLELDAAGGTLAVGHFDGRIRLWDLASGAERVALYGHRRAITALRFDRSGLQLASGSADTDVVLWDVTAEAGLFRLHGHRDAVTDLCFLDGARARAAPSDVRAGTHLLSCGKDSLIKVWDLQQQACVHTAAGHTGEVWALDASPDGSRLVTAGADDAARVWRVRLPEAGAAVSDGGALLVPAGSLARRGKARAVSVRFDPTGRVLAIASLDRAVDLFAVRSAAELKRAAKRRASRAAERAARKVRRKEARAAGTFVDGDDEAVHEADGEDDARDDGGLFAGDDGALDASADSSLEFAPMPALRASGKLSSAAFLPAARGGAQADGGAPALSLIHI